MKVFMPNRKNGIFSIFAILMFISSSYCYALTGTTYTDVPTLLKGMVSKDPAVSKKARADAGKLEKSDIPALFMEMENKDSAVSDMAGGLLVNFSVEKMLGDRENELIAALKKQLKSEHHLVRQGAAVGLTRMDRHSFGKEMIPFLIEAVKEGTPEYEMTAVSMLGDIGPDAKDAVPAIIEALKRQQEWYRITYYLALTFIGTPEALEASKGFIRKRGLAKQYAKTKGNLSTKPWPNLIVALGFGCLFWWSRKLRRAGNQVSCLPLLIPMFAWSLSATWATLFINHGIVVSMVSEAPPPLFTIFHTRYNAFLPGFLIFTTLAGTIPWLLSLWRLWKNRAASASTS